MRRTVIRSEKNVGELAEKIFGRLSEKSRGEAVDALLKLNPELKNFRKVKKGTLVEIPFVKGKGGRRKDKRDDPRQKATDLVAEKVAAYTKEVDGAFSVQESRLRAQSAALKDAKVKKRIRELKLTDLAGKADKSIKLRLEETAAQKKRTKKALKKLGDEVSALDELRG